MKNTSIENISTWLCELKRIPSGQAHCPRFLKPMHFVTMGLAVKRCGWENLRLPTKLESYASRMQLWDAIGMTAPCHVNQHEPSGKFLPITTFTNANRTQTFPLVMSEIARIIDRTLSKEYRLTLSDCLEEIISNFFDHACAHSDLPCLIAAQVWTHGKQIQIAIADAGIGIRESLLGNPELIEKLATQNACELASTYGITSKTRDHSGYGLTLAKDLMAQADGAFYLVSGHEIYAIAQSTTMQTSPLPCAWDGAMLVLEWPLDKELDSTPIYKNDWSTTVGFNEDDYF